ncbi:alpha-L-rhamnosidase [Microterricola viridarii]|uniref:alpha-L-rhamnosidase n=2 Tax=Microterricola viridarii TaxID=412690 RepID=A0A1H1VCZ9_9MICO|nr:alpha-L-rhamnosidase [Microterricola viridarii]
MTRMPFDLTIDSDGDQFVVSGPTPRMSWKVPLGLGAQIGYELDATVDGASMPTVSADSPRHLHIAWPWAPLVSAQRVKWRVRVAGTEGASGWSEWSDFEAGLLDHDWQAKWISPVQGNDPGYGKRPAHTLSVEFDLTSDVQTARLYATALGVYEAFVNGDRAGTAELSPGASSYDKTLYAQASDVLTSLRIGTNRLKIVLSDGWFRGLVGAHRMPAQWGTVLGARLELHLVLANGARQIVRTNENWTSVPSAITRADLMDGQTVDLTSVPDVPRAVLVDRVSAPAIDWSPAPAVRVVGSRKPATLRKIETGVWIADFGQNASGWIALADLGPVGTRTTIDYGEYVGPDGDLSTAHLDSSRPGEEPTAFVQRDEVVSAGDNQVFEPRHTVHGFQYARIRRQTADLDPASVTMRIVHSDLQRTGTFACSDPDLNRLHEIAEWSFLGNAVDVPTDCPTRERLAWTGDYQVFAPTATRLYDVLGFSRKWLRSVRDDQLDDGRIANFSPDGRQIKRNLDDQFAMMTGSAGWGDAITIVPWELYEAYGDREVLVENWDAMVRWVDWALHTSATARHHSRIERSTEPLPHEQYLWDGSFHWGEWTEPKAKAADGSRIDPIKHNPMAWFMADKGEVGTAFLYRSVSILARTAEVLSRMDDAERYAETAHRIRDAWRTEFLHGDGRTLGDTQASYVRALSFGLVPDELRAPAARRLVELIRAAGTHLGTGFLATGDLLPVLCDSGHSDVAYELLFQRSAPSWLYMVDRGATTIWEDWDGIDEDGNAHESLNHYSKGAVIRFLHTHTLGLRQAPTSIAWESFIVQPVRGENVTWASGSHETPQGLIRVEWRIEDAEMEITVDVPPSSSAVILFPDGSSELAAAGHFRGRRTLPNPA